MRLKLKRADKFVQSNSKTHFKLYKSGKKWVIAGISVLGGVLGMGTITTTTAKADSVQPSITKEIGTQDIMATRVTGTIPPSSAVNRQQVETSESLSGSTPQSESTQVDAVPRSQVASGETGSVTVTSQTMPVQDWNLSTGQTSSLAQATKQTRILGSQVVADTAHPVNPVSTPGVAKDQPAYQLGLSDAHKDLNTIIHRADASGLSIVNHVVGGADITTNAQKVTNLLNDYQTDQSLQTFDGYGAPVWTESNYRGNNATGTFGKFHTKDYNQGYADYLRDFSLGINDWIAGISSRAKTPQQTNELLDTQKYDPKQLTDVSYAGTAGAVVDAGKNWLDSVLSNKEYAPNVLGFKGQPGNLANDSIDKAATVINYYIRLIAPGIINGIAHQALSDIRSLGGTIDDSDYAPATLKQAVALDANMQKLVNNVGLSDLLETSLLQNIYQAIKQNTQMAIEDNWAIGSTKALQEFFHEGTVRTEASKTYWNTGGYSEETPGNILLQSGGKLSFISQKAGYAWTQKVIGNVLTMASHDALVGKQKMDVTAIVKMLQATQKISADEAAEVLTGAAHVFSAGNSDLDYRRNSHGAQQVILRAYQVMYRTTQAAVHDYQATPTLTGHQIAIEQNKYIYDNPADAGLVTPHFSVLNLTYTKIWNTMKLLNQLDSGREAADTAFEDQTIKDVTQLPATPPAMLLSIYGTLAAQLTDFIDNESNAQTANVPDSTMIRANIGRLMMVEREVRQQAYTLEKARITQAFNEGVALARQHYQQSLDGTVPPVQAAGSYQGHDYQQDGTHIKTGSGVAFQAGYNAKLVTVTIVTKTDARYSNFKTTSMAKAGRTAKTFVDPIIQIPAPKPSAGWSLVSDKCEPVKLKDGTYQVTFKYAKTAGFNYGNLPLQAGTYTGKLVGEQLQGGHLSLSWNNGVQEQTPVRFQAQDFVLEHNGTRIGCYHYHLTLAAAQALHDFIQVKNHRDCELPSVARLMAMTGILQVTQATDVALLPGLQTTDIVTVVPINVDALVSHATDAHQQPLDNAALKDHLTSSLDKVSWQIPGDYAVMVTLTDPESGQTVTKTAHVTVISQEASTSTVVQEASRSAYQVASTSASESLDFSAAASLSVHDSATASASDASLSVASWKSASTSAMFSTIASQSANESAHEASQILYSEQAMSVGRELESEFVASTSTMNSASTSVMFSAVASQSARDSAIESASDASLSVASWESTSTSTMLSAIASQSTTESVREASQILQSNQTMSVGQALTSEFVASASAVTSASISTAVMLSAAASQSVTESARETSQILYSEQAMSVGRALESEFMVSTSVVNSVSASVVSSASASTSAVFSAVSSQSVIDSAKESTREASQRLQSEQAMSVGHALESELTASVVAATSATKSVSLSASVEGSASTSTMFSALASQSATDSAIASARQSMREASQALQSEISASASTMISDSTSVTFSVIASQSLADVASAASQSLHAQQVLSVGQQLMSETSASVVAATSAQASAITSQSADESARTASTEQHLVASELASQSLVASQHISLSALQHTRPKPSDELPGINLKPVTSQTDVTNTAQSELIPDRLPGMVTSASGSFGATATHYQPDQNDAGGQLAGKKNGVTVHKLNLSQLSTQGILGGDVVQIPDERGDTSGLVEPIPGPTTDGAVNRQVTQRLTRVTAIQSHEATNAGMTERTPQIQSHVPVVKRLVGDHLAPNFYLKGGRLSANDDTVDRLARLMQRLFHIRIPQELNPAAKFSRHQTWVAPTMTNWRYRLASAVIVNPRPFK
ncbi:MAG TPA: KxYKxGKxW signal peptide domain-containing protein [Levilactobacillus hammesii]|uniref:KxYKxGKxW signal peptide domain-containing protein n=1 Tax=Levilactobacillus hammesii TaxID=267633 RepID=A0A921F2A7_9LACO|nr:KxYKxGKxW signal peptide domain-containing protein [Levilactobacillus hammesii]